MDEIISFYEFYLYNDVCLSQGEVVEHSNAHCNNIVNGTNTIDGIISRLSHIFNRSKPSNIVYMMTNQDMVTCFMSVAHHQNFEGLQASLYYNVEGF